MYNFDEIVDRKNALYSYSSKWAKNGFALSCFGEDCIPDDVIALHVADMDFKCAPVIKEAIMNVAEHGIYGYSAPSDDYYNSIKKWYLDRYELDINDYHIYHSHGTHKAIEEAVKRVTNVGDKVIVLLPSYSYHRDIDNIGRTMLGIRMHNDNGNYTIDFEEFEEACKEAKAFVLCNPQNPTGKIFSDDELIKMAYVCRFHHVVIISDEVHGDIVRADKEFKPLIKIVGPKGIITCNGINKTFNLAGLASTYFLIKDNKLSRLYEEYHSNASPFEIAATIASYNESTEWVDELNKYLDLEIEEVVNFIHKNMPKAKVLAPSGTYILWVDFSGYGLSDSELHNVIYKQAHVIAQSGSHFDDNDQFQRFCIASPKKMVMEAFGRIAKAINNRK